MSANIYSESPSNAFPLDLTISLPDQRIGTAKKGEWADVPDPCPEPTPPPKKRGIKDIPVPQPA